MPEPAADADRPLVEAYLRRHPLSSARTLERFQAAEVAAALAESPPDRVAAVLERMTPSLAAPTLAALAEPAPVLAHLRVDTAGILLRRLPADEQSRLLGLLSQGARDRLVRVLDHPEGSAGALADPTVVVLPEDATIETALSSVRRTAEQVMYYLYVVDRSGRLAGVLTLRELMLAEPTTTVGSAMRRSPARLQASADRAAVVAHPGWREFHALPVVDGAGRFVGALRYETLRLLDREAEPGPGGDLVSAALSLGELYWVGLTGVLEGLAHAAARGTGEQR